MLVKCLLSMMILLAPLYSNVSSAKDVAGWVEPVMIYPFGINLTAKLDTGAKNSSLNSTQIEIFKKGSVDYVRFLVVSREGNRKTLELPLQKNVKIKRHFGDSQTRPLVIMQICMANKLKQVPVNLVDRSGFNYQILLGRSFLEPDILIDSSITLSTTPNCSSTK